MPLGLTTDFDSKLGTQACTSTGIAFNNTGSISGSLGTTSSIHLSKISVSVSIPSPYQVKPLRQI